MSFILERKRKTPVALKADVVVAGGGPAGLGAALAAARNGAKTVLVERYGCLGGLATAGLVITLPPLPAGYSGILKEILNNLFRLGAAHRFKGADDAGITVFNPEMFKLVADRMVERAGVKLLLNSLVVDAVVKGNTIAGVVVESKSGRQAVSCKVVVDATGDGDVAAAAGAPYKIEKRELLPATLMYIVGGVDSERVRKYQRKDPGLCRAASKAGFSYRAFGAEHEERRGPRFVHMDHIARGQVVGWSECLGVDGTNAEELTRAEVKLRRRALSEVEFLRKHVPGFEGAYLATMAPYIGVRETRRIVGEYVLKENDYRKVFRDAVGHHAYSAEPHRTYGVPYRCLLPKRVDNLLVAGRCFSATHEVQNRLREIPACMAMGQVAGTAAALSVKLGVKPKQLDVELLKRALIKQGALAQ